MIKSNDHELIPVSKPSIGADELNAIKPIFDSGWLGMGSTTYAFECALSDYLGTKNVIAVNSGTSALHLALDAYGIGIGDEVIVPSLTYAATIQPIITLGDGFIGTRSDAGGLSI